MNAAAVRRLERYFQQIGDVLGEENRRSSFALYTMGPLGTGERRSMEPIAAGEPRREQEPPKLFIEWRDHEPDPPNYFLVSLPRFSTKKQLIRLVMQR